MEESKLALFTFGFFTGSMISLLFAVYIFKKIDEDDDEDDDKFNEKFKGLEKPKSLVVHDFFLWENKYESSKVLTDSLGRHRRIRFKVDFHYRATLTEDNITKVLEFEKEKKIVDPDQSTRLVGKTLWLMIRDRVIDASENEFRSEGGIFGELSVGEKIHPFDELMPGLILSRCRVVYVYYEVTNVI